MFKGSFLPRNSNGLYLYVLKILLKYPDHDSRTFPRSVSRTAQAHESEDAGRAHAQGDQIFEGVQP